MSNVEGAKWIYELQKTNPSGSDPISEGDDHLRLIKEVLKDSFPSEMDAPQVPDVSGNGSKILAVNETGTGTEWIDSYVPPVPAYPAIEWYTLRGETTSIPINTWTKINGIDHTIATDGVYLLLYGVNKWGTGAADFKENALALTLNEVIQGGGDHVYQYTSAGTAGRASYNFLSTNEILTLSEGDELGLLGYQDNGPNVNITVHAGCYLNIIRLA